QAEDGIRDWSVTGVQTCALPIPARDAILPLLRELWREERGERRKRMRIGLALMPAEPDTIRPILLQWLLEADDPREVELTRDIRSEERRVGKEGRTVEEGGQRER